MDFGSLTNLTGLTEEEEASQTIKAAQATNHVLSRMGLGSWGLLGDVGRGVWIEQRCFASKA